jgi:DNA invertase Pin-like site-specific DNA recombinase
MLYGYARVSTLDQDLSIQLDALTAAGCAVVRSEKVTGTSTEDREELATLLQFLREGDALVVTRIDRLARSLRDLQNIVHDLRQRGVTLKATEQPIDTSTAAGKCFLDMLGVFAEFETNLRRERQLEGIARAKANGAYAGKGRRRPGERLSTAKVEQIIRGQERAAVAGVGLLRGGYPDAASRGSGPYDIPPLEGRGLKLAPCSTCPSSSSPTARPARSRQRHL